MLTLMKNTLFFLTIAFASLFAHGQMEIISESPKIIVFHNYLSEAECDYLIRYGAPSLARSTVVDNNSTASKVDNVRTSKGMFFPYNHNDGTIRNIERRISYTTNIPEDNGENIQLLHYTTGAEYKPHHDFFDPHTVGGSEHLKRGGQRHATFIMYLNTPGQGGETVFPLLNIKIPARKGDALLFYNSDPNGTVDKMTLHGGAPVIAGEKWIATRWLRLGKFQ